MVKLTESWGSQKMIPDDDENLLEDGGRDECNVRLVQTKT